MIQKKHEMLVVQLSPCTEGVGMNLHKYVEIWCNITRLVPCTGCVGGIGDTGGRYTHHSILLTPGKAGTVQFCDVFKPTSIFLYFSNIGQIPSHLKSVTLAATSPMVRSRSTWTGNSRIGHLYKLPALSISISLFFFNPSKKNFLFDHFHFHPIPNCAFSTIITLSLPRLNVSSSGLPPSTSSTLKHLGMRWFSRWSSQNLSINDIFAAMWHQQ